MKPTIKQPEIQGYYWVHGSASEDDSDEEKYRLSIPMITYIGDRTMNKMYADPKALLVQAWDYIHVSEMAEGTLYAGPIKGPFRELKPPSRKLITPQETVIGTFYDVPCLVLPFINQIGGYGPDVPFVPVQLPAHHDKELGVGYQHYHIDWRFVGKASYEANLRGSYYSLMGRIIGNIEMGKVEMRRMKCKREMPIFPAASNNTFCEWEKDYAGKCIDLTNPICPHRGVNLRTSPIEVVNGKAIIVCSGHGLGWDAVTGENVPRHCADL